MFNFEDSFFSKKHSVLLSFLVFLMIFALTAVSLIACSSDSSDSVMDKTGTPYIIDITRRCSGDIYPEPVEHSTGIPWAEWIVRTECGMDCKDFPTGAKQK